VGRGLMKGEKLGGVLKFAALETFTITLPMSESRLGARTRTATAVRDVSTLLPGLIVCSGLGRSPGLRSCVCGREGTRRGTCQNASTSTRHEQWKWRVPYWPSPRRSMAFRPTHRARRV
jgi:hypothetical protein